jgi:hypothetical protein
MVAMMTVGVMMVTVISAVVGLRMTVAKGLEASGESGNGRVHEMLMGLLRRRCSTRKESL